MQKDVLTLRELEGICSESASEIVRKDRINSDKRDRWTQGKRNGRFCGLIDL